MEREGRVGGQDCLDFFQLVRVSSDEGQDWSRHGCGPEISVRIKNVIDFECELSKRVTESGCEKVERAKRPGMTSFWRLKMAEEKKHPFCTSSMIDNILRDAVY